jgi:hypothetical protein
VLLARNKRKYVIVRLWRGGRGLVISPPSDISDRVDKRDIRNRTILLYFPLPPTGAFLLFVIVGRSCVSLTLLSYECEQWSTSHQQFLPLISTENPLQPRAGDPNLYWDVAYCCPAGHIYTTNGMRRYWTHPRPHSARKRGRRGERQ